MFLFRINALRWIVIVFLLSFPSSAFLFAEPSTDNSDESRLRDYFAANGMLNRGLYDSAISEYRKFLSLHGDDGKAPVARYGLSVALFRLERFDEASKELEALSSLRVDSQSAFPYAPEVLTMLGQCHLRSKHYAEATPCFRAVVTQFSEHALADDASGLLVESLFFESRYAEAIKAGDGFLERWADSSLRDRVVFFQALCKTEFGRHQEAVDQLRALLKRNPQSTYADQVSLNLAQSLHRANALDEAIAQYQSILSNGKSRSLAEATLGLGKALRQAGRAREAGDALDRLLHDDPGESIKEEVLVERGLALFDQAIALFQSGNPSEAARLFQSFRENFPGLGPAPRALYMLGLMEHQQGHYKESSRCAKQFLADYPADGDVERVSFLIGENHFLANEWASAESAFLEYLDRYPGGDQRARGEYRLAMAVYHGNKPDEALPRLRAIALSIPLEEWQSSAVFALASIQFDRGEWNDAEQTLRKYLDRFPGAPNADEAQLKLGLALQRREDFTGAMEAYGRLLADHPDSVHRLHALFELAQTQLSLERFHDASATLQRVLSEGGGSRFAPYARNHLAAIAAKKGDLQVAAQLLKEVSTGTTESTISEEAQFRRGGVLMAANDFTEAEQTLREFIVKFPQSGRLVEAQAQLVTALARQNRCQGALNLMESIPGSALESLSQETRASLTYEQAWCLNELGEISKAGIAYEQLLASTKNLALFSHAALNLAGMEASAGHHDRAAELLSDLLERCDRAPHENSSPLLAQTVYRLACAQFDAGLNEPAIAAFDRYLRDFPEGEFIASALTLSGEANSKLGRHEAAIHAWEELIRRFPTSPSFETVITRLADCLGLVKRWTQSEDLLAAFLAAHPNSPQRHHIQFGIGWSRENQGRLDEAMTSYEGLIRDHQGPTAARAQFQVGECLFAKGEYEQAARELLKVDILYGYPEWSAAALYEAGRCFEKMGKTNEARAQFEQVILRFADTHWADLARQQPQPESLEASKRGS